MYLSVRIKTQRKIITLQGYQGTAVFEDLILQKSMYGLLIISSYMRNVVWIVLFFLEIYFSTHCKRRKVRKLKKIGNYFKLCDVCEVKKNTDFYALGVLSKKWLKQFLKTFKLGIITLTHLLLNL